jgi:hypothetical protein
MTAIGATRDNLLQQLSNLQRRRLELKALLGVTSRRRHRTLKRRIPPGVPAALVLEYQANGESMARICEELRKQNDTADVEAEAA